MTAGRQGASVLGCQNARSYALNPTKVLTH